MQINMLLNTFWNHSRPMWFCFARERQTNSYSSELYSCFYS